MALDTTQLAKALIGQEGGVLYNDALDVEVSVPAGALEDTLWISISSAIDVPELPDGVTGTDLPIHFGPDGLEFEDSVSVRISYTQEDLDAEGVTGPEDMEFWYYHAVPGEWVQLNIHDVDPVNRHIWFRVDRFCYLTCIAQTCAPVTPPDARLNQFALNHPNPFYPSTVIEYTLPAQ